MNELLRQAQKTLHDFCLNERAHHVSYEHHYMRDLWIGGAAKVVSAVVGAGVFTVLVSQVGLSGNKSPSGVPPEYRWLYWVVLLLCIAAPALTAVTLIRHDAQDAEAHLRSQLNYDKLKGQLEDLLRQYAESDGTSEAKRKEANDKYIAIRDAGNGASVIGLMEKAIQKARRLLEEDKDAS